MVGPFNAWVHAPSVGARLTTLGAVLRFRTSIDRRLLELAIITVGACWKAEYEWWAHTQMARDHGVSEAVIDAIGRGEALQFDRRDEHVVHAAAQQLATTGRLEEETYREARDLLGDQGLVELVSLCGYYTLISFTVNAFDVELPAGETPRWKS